MIDNLSGPKVGDKVWAPEAHYELGHFFVERKIVSVNRGTGNFKIENETSQYRTAHGEGSWFGVKVHALSSYDLHVYPVGGPREQVIQEARTKARRKLAVLRCVATLRTLRDEDITDELVKGLRTAMDMLPEDKRPEL